MRFLQSLLAFARPVPARVPGGDPDLTSTAAALLRGIGCEALAERVVVSWSGRLTSSAGLARPASSTVTLNPRLRDYPAELERTLRHELAHLVAYARAGRRRIKAHGAEWRQACTELGIGGESRCHALPLPRRQVGRPHAYRCPQCGFILRRVRRINPRRRMLACRACCQQHAGGRFDARFQFIEIGRQCGRRAACVAQLPSAT